MGENLHVYRLNVIFSPSHFLKKRKIQAQLKSPMFWRWKFCVLVSAPQLWISNWHFLSATLLPPHLPTVDQHKKTKYSDYVPNVGAFDHYDKETSWSSVFVRHGASVYLWFCFWFSLIIHRTNWHSPPHHHYSNCHWLSIDVISIIITLFSIIDHIVQSCFSLHKRLLISQKISIGHMQGVFFFNGPPPKKLKYGKPRLGEVTCI